MLRRVLLYMVVALAIAGVVFLRPAPRKASVAAVAAALPTLESLTAGAASGRSHLPPDARFLDAAGDVEHAITGAPAKRATAEWTASGWAIRSGAREVGRVSEFPRFTEMHRVLVAWARALGARNSIAPASTAGRAAAGIEGQLDALHALRAAGLADRAWAAGHHDATIATLGARALVWLAAESFDRAGAGEAIPARALAWSAIAAALDSTAGARETALLADVMGYPAEACELARALAASDPIRLYVLRRDEVLDAMASRGGSGREGRWLALRRTVQRGDAEAWEVAAERGFESDTLMSLPRMNSALELGRFETGVAAGAQLLGAVVADLRLNDVSPAPDAAVEGRDLGQAMEMFETLLESIPESADGAFLDRGVLRAWYRAAFYSSLMSVGEHLRARSDFAATQDFAHDLGDGSHAPEVAAEFQRWFAHVADPRQNADLRANLQADLAGLAHFGHGPRLATWAAISRQTNHADPFVPECARGLAPSLDSRPATLRAWADLVGQQLFDLAAAEPMWDAATRAAHPRDLLQRGWWAAYRGDRATLDRLLADPGFEAGERSALISTLRYMTPEDSLRLDRLCDELVADHSDDWGVQRAYARNLAERHAWDRVRALARGWLARADRSQRAADDIDARNRLAEACLADGHIAEGYEAIQSVIGSWEQTAILLGSELLERQGRGAEAETLAMRAWQRDPGSDDAQAQVISSWWRQGKFDAAARTLAAARNRLSDAGWKGALGRRFVTFEHERPRDARRIVDALVAAKLDDWQLLGGLVAALTAAGRNEAAAEFAAKIRKGAAPEKFGALAAYQNVKTARGEAAAVEWLRTHLPDADPRTLAYLHLSAYGHHASELLWVLPLPAGPPEVVESLWLARVAAALRDGIGTPEQLDELRAAFAAPGRGAVHHYARMLLRAEPVDSVLALRLDASAAGAACYYIGLRRQSEGDCSDAARWYSRALAANAWNSAEHAWAMDQLVEWINRARTLERIDAEQRRRGETPFANPASAALVLR